MDISDLVDNKSRYRVLSFDDSRKQKFIEALATYGNITSAAGVVGVSPSTVKKHMADDEYFAECVSVARANHLAKLEAAAHKRAVDGIEKDIYFKGVVVGKERVYSDGLLQTLLAANDRERYGKSGGDVSVNVNNGMDNDQTKQVMDKLAQFLKINTNPVTVEAEYTEEKAPE